MYVYQRLFLYIIVHVCFYLYRCVYIYMCVCVPFLLIVSILILMLEDLVQLGSPRFLKLAGALGVQHYIPC